VAIGKCRGLSEALDWLYWVKYIKRALKWVPSTAKVLINGLKFADCQNFKLKIT
jgi:hypothetical protein